jgi:hypothetical protein
MSNQKALCLPREHEIYHRIAPYVIDPGDMIRVNHACRSRKQDGRQRILRSDELLSFQTSNRALFY